MAVILTSPCLLSSCQDALDLENRDICTAVVADKQNDSVFFYVEIPQILSVLQQHQSDLASGQNMSISIVKGGGKTFSDARLSLDRALNNPLYLGAVQSLVITERLADSGIDEYTLRVRQLTDYRKTMNVIVTPDTPEDFLGTRPSNQATVGFAIEDTLNSMIEQGATYRLSLADLLQKLESKNPCYLINTLAVRDGEIKLIGSAVFDGGKRIGFIPFEESRGITLMTARRRNKPTFNYIVTVDGHTFALETALKKRSVKAGYIGEKPFFDVTLRFDALGLYPSGRVRISDDVQRQLSEKLEEQISGEIIRTIEQSQKEFECDYLAFNRPFRISNPDAYNSLNWKDAFKKAEFKVAVTVKVIPNRSVDYNPEPDKP